MAYNIFERRHKMSNQTLIRPKEVCIKYCISMPTFYRWVAQGKLPPKTAKYSPKCAVYNAEEIDKAFKEMAETNSDVGLNVNKEVSSGGC
jgi:predicted DNA-binding transcriptional regulator AlpA